MRGFPVQLLVLGLWLAIFHDTSFTNGRPSRDGWQRGRIARWIRGLRGVERKVETMGRMVRSEML